MARAGSDLGRYEVTHDSTHRWQFKTPILRNVSLTAPYMHDGSLATLREVVEFYNQGGFPNEVSIPGSNHWVCPSRKEADLVEFLESLTGDNIDELVRDARSHAVGDISD